MGLHPGGSTNYYLKKVFKTGDVIILAFNDKLNNYELSQIPKVNGGMVVLENKTGIPCISYNFFLNNIKLKIV